MSGVVKAVGKVFKKVVSAVKKVLPVALMVGAVVFTGGAALGALPTWGTAVSGLVSQMGAGSVLSSVLTGAITQAGYGAVMGAATSALTGGNIMKGAQMGALSGAVTGGVTGGLGGEVDPLGKAITGQPTAPASQTGTTVSQGASSASQTGAAVQNVGPVANGPPTNLLPANMSGGVAPGAPASGGGLLSQGGWLERNQTLAGNVAGGLGQGLLKMAGDSGKESTSDALRTKADIIRGNYSGTGSGLLAEPDMAYMQTQPGRPTPAQRFDPRTYNGTWVYDPGVGKIVYVPNQQA